MRDVNTRNGVFANEGWGGGVFNGNTAFGSAEGASGIRGLGLPLADPVAAGDDPRFPWGQFSIPTITFQQSLNELLVGKGRCKLTVDGKIGPRTCGAADSIHPSPLAANRTCENRRDTSRFIAPSRPPCGPEALPPFLPPIDEVPPDPPAEASPAPITPPPAPPPPAPAPPPPAPPAPVVPVKEGSNKGMMIMGLAALVGVTVVALAAGKKKRK